jgi:hypothetical protein
MTPAEYYRERNRKIRQVLPARFGNQNVGVTAGSLQGRVIARIDSNDGAGELINLVRKFLIDAGMMLRLAGRPATGLIEKRAPIVIDDNATVWRHILMLARD